jgi:hypothetical protein
MPRPQVLWCCCGCWCVFVYVWTFEKKKRLVAFESTNSTCSRGVMWRHVTSCDVTMDWIVLTLRQIQINQIQIYSHFSVCTDLCWAVNPIPANNLYSGRPPAGREPGRILRSPWIPVQVSFPKSQIWIHCDVTSHDITWRHTTSHDARRSSGGVPPTCQKTKCCFSAHVEAKSANGESRIRPRRAHVHVGPRGALPRQPPNK